MNFLGLLLRRHVLAFTFSAFIVIFGIMSFIQMGSDRYPQIEQATLSVSTNLNGASAEVIDQSITQKLESALSGIAGIQSIESNSRTGRSNIRLTFDLDKDIDIAFNEVQAKLQRVIRQLPETAAAPIITKADSNSGALIILSLSGDRSQNELYRYADLVIRPQLENINGVAEVQIRGRGQQRVSIAPNIALLSALNLSVQDIVDTINKEHQQQAGGILTEGNQEILLSLNLALSNMNAVQNLVIVNRDGRFIRIKDVASVTLSEGDSRSITRLNQQPAINLGLIKIPNSHTVAISQEVLKRLEQNILPNLPQGIELSVTSNNSSYVEAMIGALENHLIEGTLLAALVIWLFLHNFRATIIISLAIPVSLLGAIAIMYALGYTLNTLTLLALLLLIGVVVDDAIVVLESIHRKQMQGLQPFDAALQGTQEVIFAVLASTLAIAAVFTPAIFLNSATGRLFNAFALVVTVGVLVSLFVSLTLTPSLCAQFLRHEHKISGVGLALENFWTRIDTIYTRILEKALKYAKTWVFISLLLTLTGIGVASLLKGELYPSEDEGGFMVSLRTAQGMSFDFTDQKSVAFEALLSQHPDIETTLALVGGFSGGNATQAQYIIGLKERSLRQKNQQQVMQDVRKFGEKLPGVRVTSSAFSRAGESRGGSLRVLLLSNQRKDVLAAARTLSSALEDEPGIGKSDTDVDAQSPTLKVHVDREAAAQSNLSTQTILKQIAQLTTGVQVGNLELENGDLMPMWVSIAPDQVNNDQIEQLKLKRANAEPIPLNAIVRLERTLTPQQIDRAHLQYASSIVLNPELPLQEAMTLVQKRAQEVLAPNIRLEFAGEAKELQDNQKALYLLVGLAMVSLYLILAAQFNHFGYPLLVMLSTPLAITGGVLALWLFKQTLNVYSVIGLILLMGLVAKNAILLIDATLQKMAQGMRLTPALVESGRTRLRPVLMTSLTVILALMPTALGLGVGAETQQPMAIAIVGGMTFSTLLTLLVIPCAQQCFSKDNSVINVPKNT